MYHLREVQTKCFQFTVLFPFQHQVVASGVSLSPWRGTRGPKVSGAGGIERPGRRAEESGAGGGGCGGLAAWQPLRPMCSGADREEVHGASWVEPAGWLLSARLLGAPSLGAELSCLWSAGLEPESHETGDEDTAPWGSVSHTMPHATQEQRPQPRRIASLGSLLREDRGCLPLLPPTAACALRPAFLGEAGPGCVTPGEDLPTPNMRSPSRFSTKGLKNLWVVCSPRLGLRGPGRGRHLHQPLPWGLSGGA